MTDLVSCGEEEDKSDQWGPPISITHGRRGEQHAVRRCQAETGKRATLLGWAGARGRRQGRARLWERHRNGRWGKVERGSSGLRREIWAAQ